MRDYSTYEDWLENEAVYAAEIAEPKPYVSPYEFFGRPKGWEPGEEGGFAPEGRGW